MTLDPRFVNFTMFLTSLVTSHKMTYLSHYQKRKFDK